MQLSSPAFADGSEIPIDYVSSRAGGKDVSPPLEWSGAPEGTKSVAVTVVDEAPVARDFVHWVVIDIPPSVSSLSNGEGSTPAMPGRQLTNSAGTRGWSGPKPPPGTGVHPYVFTVWALDSDHSAVSDHPDASELQAMLGAHALSSATITGRYGE